MGLNGWQDPCAATRLHSRQINLWMQLLCLKDNPQVHMGYMYTGALANTGTGELPQPDKRRTEEEQVIPLPWLYQGEGVRSFSFFSGSADGAAMNRLQSPVV